MTDIDEVYKTLGFGRMQLTAFVTCFLIQVWISNEQLGIAVVIAGATCELDITDKRVSWLMAFNFAAQMLFSLVWGTMGDRCGRRRVLLITGTAALTASLLSALMPEFWSFMAMRVLVGAFLAGPVGVLMTYMGELTKISLRPKVLNFLSYAIAISMIQVPTVASIILPLDMDPIASWRVLAVLDLIPGICGMIGMLFMSESAKFYLSVDQDAKAMKVLERNCRWNKGKNVTLASLGIESVTQSRLQELDKGRCSQAKTLLTKYVRYMTLMGFAFLILSGIGVSLPVWMLRIRVKTKLRDEALTVCEHLGGSAIERLSECKLNFDDLLDAIIHGFVLLFTFIVTSLLLCCLKRRVVILIYVSIAIAGSLSLNFARHTHLQLLCFFALIDPPMSSIRMAMSLVIDLIPTHLRGKALALMNIMGRIGIMSVSLFVGYSLGFNCHYTFNTLMVLLVICGILLLLLPSEKSVKDVDHHDIYE